MGGGSITRSLGPILAHALPVEVSGRFCPWVEGLLMTSKNFNHLTVLRRKNGVSEMELRDAQMSLWLSALNPYSVGATTHHKLTTAQLSLQFSLSLPCHGARANTEVKSLWHVCACGRPGSDGPGPPWRPQP